MTACVGCKNTNLRPYSPYRHDQNDQFKNLFPNLKILACTNCGLTQVDHDLINLNKLDEYYSQYYRADGHSSATSAQMRQRRYHRGQGLLNFGAAHLDRPPRRIFEFGAGHQLNLQAAHDLWPEATLACDDPDAAALATTDGPNILQGDISALDGGFDIILLCHVLEHLKDPAAVLAGLCAHLAPGGILLIEVPNDRADVLAAGKVHDPHVTFFTPSTLRTLFDVGLGVHVAVQEVATSGPPLPRPGMRAKMLNARRALKRKLVKSFNLDLTNPFVDPSVFTIAAHDDTRGLLRLVARAPVEATPTTTP